MEGSKTGRRQRVCVTLTTPMMVAIEILAEREGRTQAGEATLLLRQALARTIDSAECQNRLAKRNVTLSNAQWRVEMESTAAELRMNREMERQQ